MKPEQYNLNDNNSKYIYAFISLIYSIITTYCAGELSAQIAQLLVIKGFIIPMREQINVIMVLFFYFMYVKLYRAPENSIKFGGIVGFLLANLIILLILFTSWGLMIFSGQIEGFKFTIPNNLEPFTILISLIFMLMHGFAEQFLIQKLVQQNFNMLFGERKAILAAGLAFASLQFWQGYTDVIYVINSLILGALMALIAIKFGFIAAASLHGLWTFFETQIFPLVFDYNIINKPFLNIGIDSYGSWYFGIISLIFSLLFYKYFFRQRI